VIGIPHTTKRQSTRDKKIILLFMASLLLGVSTCREVITRLK
jgi:hypothetical protein